MAILFLFPLLIEQSREVLPIVKLSIELKHVYSIMNTSSNRIVTRVFFFGGCS